MRVGACEVRAAATMTSPCNAVPPTCKCKRPALQLFIAPSHPRLHTPTAPARPPARPPGLLPSGPSWHIPQPMHHILQHQSKPSRAGQAAAIQSCTLMSHQPPACASCAACHMHLAGPAARESQHSMYLCAPGGGDEWCATRSCCWPPLPATPHPAARSPLAFVVLDSRDRGGAKPAARALQPGRVASHASGSPHICALSLEALLHAAQHFLYPCCHLLPPS